MGKHERDWVEAAEQAVSDGLNGQEQNLSITKVVSAIQEKIGIGYEKAVWTGGRDYKDPGDVHVIRTDRKDRIELKFSHASGSGTAKNISQKTLTKKIDSSIVSYQQWDIDQGLKLQRYDLVESKIGRKLKTASDYCQQLRIFRDSGDPIIDAIAQITSPGQESYAKYAAEQLNQYLDKVNGLVHDILGTTDLDESHQDVLYCVIKNFESEKQTTEFFDFTDLDKFITRVESSGKSIKFLNSSGKDVLRFSVTWKNICQGGATPCFNVFVGNAFRN
jgi:hypothetical protein